MPRVVAAFPTTEADLRERIAELEAELDAAHTLLLENTRALVAAADHMRELQLLRKEHKALQRYFVDIAPDGFCPLCAGPVHWDNEVKHRPGCPFKAVEQFQE